MNGITFDTLNYSKTLQEAGMPQEQAEAFARAQKNAFDEMMSAKELATNADIREAELRLQTEIERTKFALAVIMAKGFGWLGF